MHARTEHATMQLIFKKYRDTAGDLLRSIFFFAARGQLSYEPT